MKKILRVALHLFLVASMTGAGGFRLSGVSINKSTAATSYTIAIIGDIQDKVQACADSVSSAGCLSLIGMMDDINSSASTRNTQMAMFVGDVTNTGTVMPPEISYASESARLDGETVGSWTVPYTTGNDGVCATHNGDFAGCQAEAGCFLFDNQNNGTAPGSPDDDDCLSGGRWQAIDDEWDAFDSIVMSRFETLGDMESIIAVIAKGNHDTPGNGTGSDTDPAQPQGWNDRYGQPYWEAREAQHGTSKFEHLATYSDPLGNSYAWKANLMGTDHVIVSVPFQSNGDPFIPTAAVTFAIDQAASRLSDPAILLGHYNPSLWDTIVDVSETEMPNLWLEASGHNGSATGGNDVRLRTNGSEVVAAVSQDHSNATRDPDGAGPAIAVSDFVVYVEVFTDTDEIEITAYSPSQGVFDDGTTLNDEDLIGIGDTDGPNYLAKTAFDITPPAPYDMSAHETALAAMYNANGEDRFEWARPPIGPFTETTTTDCATIQSAMTGTKQKVTVDGVVSGSCAVSFSGSHLILKMTDSAEITTTATHPITGSRIKIEGGHLESTAASSVSNIGGSDILFLNTKYSYYILQANSGTSLSRLSVVNSDFTARGWGFLTTQDDTVGTTNVLDTTFANVCFMAATAGGGNHGGFRVQDSLHHTVVDSWIQNESSNSPIRMQADASYHLYTGNVIWSDDGDSSQWHQIYARTQDDPDTPDNEGADPGDLDWFRSTGNTYVRVGGATANGSAGFISPPSSCEDIYVEGNDVFSSTTDPFSSFPGASSTACSPLTWSAAANTMHNFSGSIYDTSPPDCNSLGIGADH